MIMVCVFKHGTIIQNIFACMHLLHCKLEGFFGELREKFFFVKQNGFFHSTEWLF